MYANEERIGEALRQTEVPRKDIFLTTKIRPPRLDYEDVRESFAVSLDKLQTDYVDLLLIHWPSSKVPVSETIKAMNELQADKRVTYIGVSNFSVQQTREAMDASRTPIITNQVHYDPFRNQSQLLEFCIQNDIMLTAYSPLAKGRAVKNSKLREIGEKYGKTASQVTLRWLTQQNNVSAIPKAGNPDHQQENLNIFDFELSLEDMEKIFELQGGMMGKLRSLIGIL
jgi:diketogulonate reductase-like aldo/keto reductase